MTPAPEPKLEAAGRSAQLLAALRKAVEAQRAGRPDGILDALKGPDIPADDRDCARIAKRNPAGDR